VLSLAIISVVIISAVIISVDDEDTLLDILLLVDGEG
jgi:hypothetical protein